MHYSNDAVLVDILDIRSGDIIIIYNYCMLIVLLSIEHGMNIDDSHNCITRAFYTI